MTPTDHPHYHSRQKGCRIVVRKEPASHAGQMMRVRFCKTHNEEVCAQDQCGWSWFWHGGEYTDPRVPIKLKPRNETQPTEA